VPCGRMVQCPSRRQPRQQLRHDAGQAVAYLYSRDNEAEARQAKVLTKDDGSSLSRGCQNYSGKRNATEHSSLSGRGKPNSSRGTHARGRRRGFLGAFSGDPDYAAFAAVRGRIIGTLDTVSPFDLCVVERNVGRREERVEGPVGRRARGDAAAHGGVDLEFA
jgi:hypothetical protein